MSRAPLQTTLNEWVNVEAIGAYINQLDKNCQRIDEYGWLRGATEKQTNAIYALVEAAAAMRAALEMAHTAEVLAREVHYDRLYNREASAAPQ